MPRLEDLKQDLLTMTPEEIRASIRKIRADRIIRKGPKKAEKVARVKKTKTIDTLLAALSPADIAKLLDEMGE